MTLCRVKRFWRFLGMTPHLVISQPVWWAVQWSGLSWWWRKTASLEPQPPDPTSPLEAWWRSSRSVQRHPGKYNLKTPNFSSTTVQPLSTRGCCLTFGWLVSMLYHRMEAQALGIWQMFEMTTTGREWVCTNGGKMDVNMFAESSSLLKSLVILLYIIS